MADLHDPRVTLAAPMSGDAIALEDIPDPVFSSGALGNGYGVNPSSNQVVAPISGTITMIAGTKHAFGFKSDSGLEVLLHLGVDTVELKGKPFEVNVAVGDQVEAGQQLATMDLKLVKAAGKGTTAITVITNTNTHLAALTVNAGTVAAGEPAAVATLKGEAVAGASATAATQAAASAVADKAAKTEYVDANGKPLAGFDLTAAEIIDGIGGAENVSSVIHCITRVRFYLKDESQAKDAQVRDIDGVIDVAKAGGQYQVVIGATVGEVYEAIVKQLPQGSGANADEQAAEPKERPTTPWGWISYGFSSLIGVITGSMIPVVGVLAASGILKGILALLTQFNVVASGSDTYKLITAMSDSMFYFLPIIIGFTAAKRLGSDPIIVAIIGGVLAYPQVVAMSNPDAEGYHKVATLGRVVFNAEFFGIPVSLPQGNAYAYSIFPIIVAAWLAAKIEPWLKRLIPAVVRGIFAPLLEIFIVSALIFTVFGPVVMFISGGIASVLNWILASNYAVAGLIIGGFYQCLVIFGLHWAVIPIISQQIADPGYSPLNAIVSATMIAQGGAAMAVWIKTRNHKIKRMAGPATISALCGVTEPAMYGLNLKYGRIFITGSIGGAVGGLLTGLLNVNMWGFTGAFVGFPSFVNPKGMDGSFTGFWIASVAALVVAFAVTWFFGFKDSDFDEGRTVEKKRLGKREPVAK